MTKEEISASRKIIIFLTAIIASFVLTAIVSLLIKIVSDDLTIQTSSYLLIFILPFIFYRILINDYVRNKEQSAKTEKHDAPKISPEKRKINELELQVSTQKREISELKKKLTKADGIISDLMAKNNELQHQDNTDAQFKKVKRAFAQRYHPDNIHSNGIDKLVREEIFKEFWEEIRKIEEDD